MRRLVCFVMCVALGGAADDGAHQKKMERWSVKTSVPDSTDFAKPASAALSDLLQLPNAAGVTRNDSRFQLQRIPSTPGDRLPEGKLVSTVGFIHLIAREPDGDYHIQMSVSATDGDHCLIVEVPNPDPEFTASAELRPKFQAVRDFVKARMLDHKEPSTSGSVMQREVFVTVTGILYYDAAHVGDNPRGKKGMKAATLWELHPVTAIEFAVKPN